MRALVLGDAQMRLESRLTDEVAAAVDAHPVAVHDTMLALVQNDVEAPKARVGALAAFVRSFTRVDLTMAEAILLR